MAKKGAHEKFGLSCSRLVYMAAERFFHVLQICA